ncbi:hypothetical protein C8R44DRAFT_982655 [Mycena epipterygia]|nr:hypothetical protein C8R44DRAFT_982655 [Mycena epipterygia]
MTTISYILSTSMAQSPSTPTQATSMSDEQMDLVEILRSGEDSRLRRHRPERNDGPALPAVVLFCGADQDIEDWDEHRPGFVQMLPDMAPPPARKRQKKSNGCGARIHARAVPERRWRGLLDGVSGDVVPLQDEYFTPDMRRELLLGKERCGCARSGVGCAICGNPLGILFTPCPRHAPSSPNTNFSSSHYTFLRGAVSPPLPLPTRPVPTSASASDREIPTGRGEREALARRLRDREELHQLRARMRAAQQQPQPQPPPQPHPHSAGSADEHRLEVSRLLLAANAGAQLRRADRDRERRLRMDAGDPGFEAWADATMRRATATADAPVVLDLSALVEGRPATPPGFTSGSGPGTSAVSVVPPPRELSDDERRREWQQREWQRGVVSAASRSFGRDWPTVTRTVERTTAVPETIPVTDIAEATPMALTRPTLEDVLARHPRETEEQEKEEAPGSRTFFER